MRKTFNLALLLAVSFPVLVYAAGQPDSSVSENYQLDEAAVSQTAASAAPKVVKEELPDGATLEKLVTADGLVIAEKTVKNGDITKKVLNYYYPNGKLSRRVTAMDDGTGFYAESYYMNGKLSSEASYINEGNKIGKEKKYDATGTLRQEIPWYLPKDNSKKPLAEQQTIRRGNVLTYYPDGRLAASLPVGYDGKAVFFNREGRAIKTVENAKVLNFAPELTEENCRNSVVNLSLENLVELYEDEGDISYNKCGMPYRESFMYEVSEVRGIVTTKISYDETGMIRRITPYKNGRKNGVEQKYDSSGNLTADVNYKNGVKDGTASGYFPTREIAFRKRYQDGKVVDKLTCYFPTGDVAAEFSYKNGLKEGTAKIYGPNAREITFSGGQIAEAAPKSAKRLVAPSKLSALQAPDAKCLDLGDKLDVLAMELEANANTVTKAFTLDMPYGCTDFASFKPEKSNYACYDANNQLRAIYPTAYNRGEYALETVYTVNGDLLYNIPHFEKQRQGVAQQYGKNGKVIADIYFNRGELAESSRSYYDNGAVKEILTISDNSPRKLLVRYAKDGSLQFSLNYDKGEKADAFLADPEKNKDIFLSFYQDKLDYIREVNAANPENYIEYNLALGEYMVYKNNELIKGGKICGFEQLNPDIEIAQVQAPAPKPLLAPQPEVKTEMKAEPQPAVKPSPAPVVPATVSELQPEPQKITVPAAKIAPKPEEELAPVIPAEAAPMVEGLEPVSLEDFKVKNAIIPTAEEKKQAELAAKNIGPVAKPEIGELTDVVAKERLDVDSQKQPEALSKTEKFYYPNGNLRKTVKTKGSRTEEVKEYSKSGLLLTDTAYNSDGILVEKYFGTGEIRRKTNKAYTDNPVMAFVARTDFYDTGTQRYEISRTPETLLFADKQFYPDGTLKEEALQTAPLSFMVKTYAKDGKLVKIAEQQGANILVKEYDRDGKLKSFSLNGTAMPEKLAESSAAILKDNAKVFAKNGALTAEFKTSGKADSLTEYYKNGKPKTEIIFYNNGEISVKAFASDGTLEKFAYLAPDGKLHIQKPEVRTVPSYRERYWVDYNNPRWIENQDKYSIKSIARLNLDTAAYILAELEMKVPDLLQKLYGVY